MSTSLHYTSPIQHIVEALVWLLCLFVENRVVDWMPIDKVREHLVGGLGPSLWHHVSCSFYRQHRKVVYIVLVETGVLVTSVPRSPPP